MNLTLTPEELLVLAAMKLKPTAEEIARMERLVAEVQDWNYCTRLAIDRGIGPLLNHKIPMLGNSHLIPPEAQARLQQSYLRTLARSMRLYEAFREVGTALNNAGIKFVALKGVYLAEALYEDIGLRLFSDIDLLVAEEDGERSLEVLREVGYEDVKKKTYKNKFLENNIEIIHFPQLVKNEAVIEIHIKLHRSDVNYEFDIPLMLNESNLVNINTIKAFRLNKYDQLIHLLIHIDKHFKTGNVQFSGYADVINLLNEINKEWDWSEFYNRCKIHKCVFSVLSQLKILYSFDLIEVPIIVSTNESFYKHKRNQELFHDYLIGKKHNKILTVSISKELHRQNNLWKKIKFILFILHPDKEFMIKRYRIKNEKLFFVYYFVRYYEAIKTLFQNLKL